MIRLALWPSRNYSNWARWTLARAFCALACSVPGSVINPIRFRRKNYIDLNPKSKNTEVIWNRERWRPFAILACWQLFVYIELDFITLTCWLILLIIYSRLLLPFEVSCVRDPKLNDDPFEVNRGTHLVCQRNPFVKEWRPMPGGNH